MAKNALAGRANYYLGKEDFQSILIKKLLGRIAEYRQVMAEIIKEIIIKRLYEMNMKIDEIMKELSFLKKGVIAEFYPERLDALTAAIKIVERQKPISINDQKPEDYKRILWYDNRDLGNWEIGYFVPSQTEIPSYVVCWIPLPEKP